MEIADAQQGLQEESVGIAKKAIGVLMQMAAKVSFMNKLFEMSCRYIWILLWDVCKRGDSYQWQEGLQSWS